MKPARFPDWRVSAKRYGVALVATLIAAALRQSVAPWVGNAAAVLPFAPAVMVGAWYGGLGPGLFATALGVLAADYLWLDPPYTLSIPSLGETVGLALFLFTGAVISVLCEALHRQQRQTREAAWKLVETEQQFHQLLDGIRDYAIARLDLSGAVVHWMPGAERVTGYPAAEALGVPFTWFFFPEEPHLEGTLEAAREKGAFEWEARHRRKDEESFWANAVISPLDDPSGTPSGFALIVRDVTERRQAEALLRASREDLRELSAHLQSVREEERSRIAREIHDELGQSLSFLKMGLSWLKAEVTDQVLPTLTQLCEIVDATVRSIRRIAEDLRPTVLDELGIAAAIEWQVKAFSTQTGIEITFQSEAPAAELDGETGTALFRICQEALTNVVRHAHARRVLVRLEVDRQVVVLTVDDDGTGITAEEAATSLRFGILGMRERAVAAGGSLQVQPLAGTGTRVRAQLPVCHPRKSPRQLVEVPA